MQNNSALLIIDVQLGFINDNTKAIPSLIEKRQMDYDHVWAVKLEYSDNSPFIAIRRHNGFINVSNATDLAFKLRPDASPLLRMATQE